MIRNSNAFNDPNDSAYDIITQFHEEAIRHWNHIDDQLTKLDLALHNLGRTQLSFRDNSETDHGPTPVKLQTNSTEIVVTLKDRTMGMLKARATKKGMHVSRYVKHFLLWHLLLDEGHQIFGDELIDNGNNRA